MRVPYVVGFDSLEGLGIVGRGWRVAVLEIGRRVAVAAAAGAGKGEDFH